MSSEANRLKLEQNRAERAAKPLCVGSIPTRASKFFNNLAE
jgi:hypothetical protein